MLFVCFTFIFLLWFGKVNRSANRFLAVALVVVVLWITRVLAVDIQFQNYFTRWDRLPMQFLLALGPLIYFYVLKITRPVYEFRWKDLLHFSPLLLEQIALVLEINESNHTGAATYDTTVFQQLNPVLQLLIFISLITYLYRSHRLIENFYRQLQPVMMDRSRLEFRWLRRLLAATAMLWILWIGYAAVDYFGYSNQLGLHVYYPVYISFVAVIIWTAAAAFLKPQAGMLVQVAPAIRPAVSIELKQKGTWLRQTIERNLYYQDPDLTLRSLAEILNLNPNELSRIINTALKKSFNDFINEYRIREVTRKMQDPTYDRMTLFGIALDAGFNSKSTFNRAFRQMTGKSPAEYKSWLEKERPTYTLTPHSTNAAIISLQQTVPRWSYNELNRSIMFKNYFKIAWRNLVRNKSYAAINIFGLAVGIAACLLVFLIVQFETSFDSFHKKRNSIYRVVTASKGPNGLELGSGVPFPTSEALRIDYPQLKSVAAILRYGGQYTISGADSKQPVTKFKEDDGYFCEPQFFDIFDFGWLAGDKKNALAEPNTAVLTQGEAEKFFGDWHNAIGKIIRYNTQRDLKITGIVKNFPDNSDFPVKILMSYATLREKDNNFSGNMNDWVSIYGAHYVFIVLPPSLRVAQFNQDLAAFVKKHKPVEYRGQGMQLQPLSDMHYNTKVHIFGSHTAFSKELINAISLIGLFLLLIACVNFINLATAQAVNRSKEVGIRKVMGGNRKQLVLQFLSETFLITLFAVAIAIFIALVGISRLNTLLEISLTNSMLIQPAVLAFIGATIVCVTLLSGFYPAIVLSGFNPVTALRNKITAGKAKGISLRRALVILQFGIAQVLVIGTLVIVYQMNYFRDISLGFDKDAVVVVSFPNNDINPQKLSTLRNELLQQAGIKDVSFSFASPSDNSSWNSDLKYDNSPTKTDFGANLKWADADYFKLYKLQFVAGRAYEKSDTINGYVINEALLHKLGVNNPKDAIGKYINLWDDKTKYARITGVVKDFNVSSLKNEIPPVMMASWKNVFQAINIKLEPTGINSTLASIEKLWNKTFPDGVYEYQFLDDKIANFYRQDDQLSTLYKIFAGIAIFISCLGLYGLVSFMAVQRTKEVGIRKTLGAPVSRIVYLFSKEFTLLIIVAFLISAPVGYYFMNEWLQGFAYKVPFGPGIFIEAILLSIIIAWATVGYKAVKAALANPVKSLRSE